jgi:hypothetical protein
MKKRSYEKIIMAFCPAIREICNLKRKKLEAYNLKRKTVIMCGLNVFNVI